MTETERLLAEAREICLRVHGSAPDELLREVFLRLVTEHELALAEAVGAEVRH